MAGPQDIQSYTRKVKKLFQTMDASGDGAINLTAPWAEGYLQGI